MLRCGLRARCMSVYPQYDLSATCKGTCHRVPSGRHLLTGMLALLLDELSDQPRPAGLVARAQARARVAVEVLVEQQVAAPVRVALEDHLVAEDCAPPRRIGPEDLDQP